MWARPDNVILCSAEGHGITTLTLSGGDVDGDTLFVTMHRSLLRLVEATEECLDHLRSDD